MNTSNQQSTAVSQQATSCDAARSVRYVVHRASEFEAAPKQEERASTEDLARTPTSTAIAES